MPVKTNEREYRDIDMGGIELRKQEDGQMIVQGYATKWNEYVLWDDGEYRMIEKFDQHSFDNTDLSDDIFMLNHEGRVFARTSNGTLKVEPDEIGLKVTAFLGGTQEGRKIFEEIEGGYLTKMSHGFRSNKEKEIREVRENLEANRIDIYRTVTEVTKHFDVSVVSRPANDATEISVRNISEGVIADVKQERLAIEAQRRTKEQIAIMAEMI